MRKPSLPALLLGLAALALAGWLFGPGGTAVQVEAKTWRLEIEIEKRIAEADSGWCDALPAEAGNIQRRWITDSTGSSESPDRSGKRAAPAEHCRYTLPQWRALRMVQAEGQAPTSPRWPDTLLNEGRPQDSVRPAQLGDERLGLRRAFYEIQLRAASGQTWSCRLALPQWQAQVIGSTLRLQVDRYGVANCASL
jgi:hypothetical protein